MIRAVCGLIPPEGTILSKTSHIEGNYFKGRIVYKIDKNVRTIRFTADIQNDKLNGICSISYALFRCQEIYISCHFVDNLKHGKHVENYSDRKSHHEIVTTYDHDVKHGQFYEIIDTVQTGESIRIEGTYSNGKIHGSYTKSGRDWKILCTYNNGLLHGDYIHTKQGNPLVQCHYENGLLHGEYFGYHEVDTRYLAEYCSNYIHGKKNGVYALFNSDGSVKSEISYVNDIKHGRSVTYYKSDYLCINDYAIEQIYDHNILISVKTYET